MLLATRSASLCVRMYIFVAQRFAMELIDGRAAWDPRVSCRVAGAPRLRKAEIHTCAPEYMMTRDIFESLTTYGDAFEANLPNSGVSK